jgi:hypothetical protein
MKMEQTECSEMSTYKIRTPGNYSEESIKHVRYSITTALQILFEAQPRIHFAEKIVNQGHTISIANVFHTGNEQVGFYL